MSYEIRRPTLEDVPQAAAVLRECQLHDFGYADSTEEDVAVGWRMLDLERDTWVVSEGGALVAVAVVRDNRPTKVWAFAEVLPAHRGRGLGARLLELVETRAHEAIAKAPPDTRVNLTQEFGPQNDAAQDLLERSGYMFARRFWAMAIDVNEEIPAVELPPGLRLETFAPGNERAVFDATEDAFRDHWDFIPHDYDEWRRWNVERESFDPSLWLLVLDGDEIAGASLCSVREGEGYVGILGVRQPWRRRGLGLCLLRASFAEFRRRSFARVTLHVDSENPTGATRLYELAGMRVVAQSDAYRKVLREGVSAGAGVG